MSSRSSTSSSRSSSPTLTVSSSDGRYISVHKRLSGSSISSSTSSRTFSSGSSRSFSFSTSSSDSDSLISPSATPAFIYSRDSLLKLANSPLSRMPQPQRDSLRSEVPEVMTNRKQRKAIEHFNHINAVQTAAALLAPSPARSSHSNPYRQKHYKGHTSKPLIV
ncbi:hypothetical protein H2248_012434 [Termitomyces sp. 'cryptogamus']|nr:hypothetical protein H2248_012434 [Termitomyces sp. 'cryptogamus']